MSKQLLIERFTLVSSALHEKAGQGSYRVLSEAGALHMVIQVPATRLDERNDNGRVYSQTIMESALHKAEGDIQALRLLCTGNGHPAEPYVEPTNASHVITKAWCEGGLLYNQWKILDTTEGRNLKALVDGGVSFAVSIRGLGSIDSYGNVLEDYEYLGTDAVGLPSARLWVEPKIVESKEEQVGMKTLSEVRQYVAEQAVLLRAETDKLSAFKRALVVEEALGKVALPPLELARVVQEWDQVKAAHFTETPKEVSVDKPRKALAEVKERTVQVRQETRLKHAQRMIERLQARVNESEARYRCAVEAAAQAVIGTTHLSQKVVSARQDARKAAKESAVLTKYYKEAIIQAAAAHTVAESYARPRAVIVAEAKAGKTPMREAVAKERVAVVRETPVSDTSVKVRNQTEANRTGEVKIPGYY